MSREGKPTTDPGPEFGSLLHSRRYTGTSYFLAAAFMFFPLPALALYAIATGPPQPLDFKVTTFAICVGMGAAGAALFVVKGWRKRGLTLDIYENGVRLTKPPQSEVAFLFEDVTALKKRTIQGALADLTFELPGDAAYTVAVNSSRDAAMLQELLARLGPVRWEADRGFRIL